MCVCAVNIRTSGWPRQRQWFRPERIKRTATTRLVTTKAPALQQTSESVKGKLYTWPHLFKNFHERYIRSAHITKNLIMHFSYILVAHYMFYASAGLISWG